MAPLSLKNMFQNPSQKLKRKMNRLNFPNIKFNQYKVWKNIKQRLPVHSWINVQSYFVDDVQLYEIPSSFTYKWTERLHDYNNIVLHDNNLINESYENAFTEYIKQQDILNGYRTPDTCNIFDRADRQQRILFKNSKWKSIYDDNHMLVTENECYEEAFCEFRKEMDVISGFRSSRLHMSARHDEHLPFGRQRNYYL